MLTGRGRAARFDILSLGGSGPEDAAGITATTRESAPARASRPYARATPLTLAAAVHAWLDAEIASGTPSERIVLGPSRLRAGRPAG